MHAPTLYDAAFKAGLTTAQVDWVAILNSGTINHEFLEIPKSGGATERELVQAGVVTADDIRNFTKGKSIVWRDDVWTRAAVEIIPDWIRDLLGFTAVHGLRPHERWMVSLAGTVSNRIVLPESPAAQACVRVGLPVTHLYR